MRLIILILGFTCYSTSFVPVLGQHSAEKIPSDVHVYVETTSPKNIVDKLIATPLLQALNKSSLLKGLTENKDFGRIKKIWNSISDRLQGQTSVGIRFGSVGPSIFFCAEHQGQPDLNEIAQAIATFDPSIKIVERGTRDKIRWVFLGEGGVIGADKKFLYWGERPSSLREMSRLENDKSFFSHARYQGAKREAKNYDFLTVVDVAELFKEQLRKDDQLNNAVEVLLLKAFVSDLRNTNFGYAWGSVGDLMRIRVRLINKDARPDSWDLASRSRQPIPQVKNQSAHIHLDRDLAEFWAQRLDLIPESAHPGLAEFSQTMNIFLAGFPFSDLMAKMGSGLDVVVREKAKAPGDPDLLLPQFAFLMNANFDAREQERFMVAYQTAIGVINADAAEERREPMLQGSVKSSGVNILTARFLTNPKTQNRGTEYNFTPSIAFSKGKMILSSNRELAIDVVRSLEATDKSSMKPRRGDRFHISGSALARMLQANRQNLIESRMLGEGEDEDEASAVTDALTSALKRIEYLRLNHVALARSTVWDLTLKMSDVGAEK